MFKKYYGNKYIRIPLKLLFCLSLSKVFHDGLEWIVYNSTFGIPRQFDIYSGQNPIGPPLPPPYPYPDTYEHIQNIKVFQTFQLKIYKSMYHNNNYIRHILNDHPCRQNPDIIDQFIQYGNMYRVKEYINYMFVNKLKSEGIQIPEGINQRIRQLEQYKLDSLRPIIPLL